MALAPVYGGLPVRLYSHLATAVHQVAGDPGMVHHLVHTSIRLHCTGLSLAADTATILFCYWLIQSQYSLLIGSSRVAAGNTSLAVALAQWFSEETDPEQIRWRPVLDRGHIQIIICYLQILLQILSNGSVISVYSVCQYSPLQIDQVYFTVWLNRYPVKCRTHYK